ncbi:lanthionine synthetase LanC family protein [Kribbella sp.]|uniref:lanthionine synthetase LanC family protein n=1 Tax=Kribbella sp. TaxID=1871183 RepID=UPI002D64CCBE|nr:lanthionine synthetase LanC family protein [Kribbella sp.]HZX03394.1 lanthionine synthetase LanC family protein [Kribbella sp.]
MDQYARGEQAEELARAGADWLAGRASSDDLSLYHGLSGVVIALHEAHQHFGDDRFGEVAASGADKLAARVDELEGASLYAGLTGVAVALHALGDAAAAQRALDRVRDQFDGQRWNEMFELLVGNAGIGLGALQAGDLDLAVTAVTPYLSTADKTPYGVNWAVRPSPARSHHIAHGTLGIVHALAAVGRAAGRDDLIELALEGAADVAGRNEAGTHGFLVPHSDPPHRPDIIERYSYGWCNGPAGDAQTFRLLGQVTADDSWTDLGERCWNTVRESGLPRRIRPGFWDNNGRCCGTAGVLALACDRIVERGDDFEFANVLVDDLTDHATADDAGVRWSNYEHRATPSVLEPHTGWAMGSAGILRELLRYARLSVGAANGYAVPWPDHPLTP